MSAKYTSEADDEALVNWKEMILIRAEAASGQGAIDLVNTLRTADNLPRITYITGATATPLQIRQMIIEERRRALLPRGPVRLHRSSRTWTCSGSRGATGTEP